MYDQSLMVGLRTHAIASCPQTTLGYNASVIREQLSIAENQKLLFEFSFGFEDQSSPANQFESARAALTETVRFYD